jgi:hypothetical protein
VKELKAALEGDNDEAEAEPSVGVEPSLGAEPVAQEEPAAQTEPLVAQ